MDTISPGRVFGSGFATKLIVVEDFLLILIDLLNSASSENTILPSLPLKEEGIPLLTTKRDVWATGTKNNKNQL